MSLPFLNPINYKTPQPIDLKRSTLWGTIKELTYKSKTRNIFAGMTEFHGQILREIEDPEKWENAYAKAILYDYFNIPIRVFKVYIHNMHSVLPMPKTFDQTKDCQLIIDCYPDFIYLPDKYNFSVGDYVICKFPSPEFYEDGFVIKPFLNKTNTFASSDFDKNKDSFSEPKDAFNNKPLKCEDLIDYEATVIPLTIEKFKKIFSSADEAILKQYLDSLNSFFIENSISSARRVAFFLGQIGRDTNELRYFKEQDSGTKYDGDADLGNYEAGDGPKYIKRGLMGIRGRALYDKYSSALGIDLINNPELLETFEVGLKLCSSIIKENSLLQLADNWDLETITGIIDVDKNGLDQKKAMSEKALKILANNC